MKNRLFRYIISLAMLVMAVSASAIPEPVIAKKKQQATDDTSFFSVFIECEENVLNLQTWEDECTSYRVIKTVNDDKSILAEDLSRKPTILFLEDENFKTEYERNDLRKGIYHVKYSCGNYCRTDGFYSETNFAMTDNYVVINAVSHCLIEMDWDKTNSTNSNGIIFTARSPFEDESDKVIIYQSDNLYPSATLTSKVTSALWDGNDLNLVLLGADLKDINVQINNVCQ